jgi:hypothetical protein
MATYDQLPATLNLRWTVGNDFSALLDFDIGLTNYTAAATVYSTITGNPVATFTTTIPDAAAGKINVALTDSQTTAIGAGTFAWQLVWTVGTVTRTAMAGFIDATI